MKLWCCKCKAYKITPSCAASHNFQHHHAKPFPQQGCTHPIRWLPGTPVFPEPRKVVAFFPCFTFGFGTAEVTRHYSTVPASILRNSQFQSNVLSKSASAIASAVANDPGLHWPTPSPDGQKLRALSFAGAIYFHADVRKHYDDHRHLMPCPTRLEGGMP